jgi:hypothetical protein
MDMKLVETILAPLLVVTLENTFVNLPQLSLLVVSKMESVKGVTVCPCLLHIGLSRSSVVRVGSAILPNLTAVGAHQVIRDGASEYLPFQEGFDDTVCLSCWFLVISTGRNVGRRYLWLHSKMVRV